MLLLNKLNLPVIPATLIPGCLEKINDIDVDPKLDFYNHYRQPMNRAAFLTPEVTEWIDKSILQPNFSSEQLAEARMSRPNNTLLNVTTYHENGTHPIHVDIQRNYALNYYIDVGGSNTRIRWYSSDRTEVIYESDPIVPHTWYLLKVRPELHEVVGIEPNRTRIFLTMSILSENTKNFDESEFFKTLLSR